MQCETLNKHEYTSRLDFQYGMYNHSKFQVVQETGFKRPTIVEFTFHSCQKALTSANYLPRIKYFQQSVIRGKIYVFLRLAVCELEVLFFGSSQLFVLFHCSLC